MTSPIVLTVEQIAIAEKLQRILFPYASRSADEIKKRNGRFVHYTSAENALKILSSKCVWMRNTNCMSDYREVSHGLDALNRYLANSDHKQAFTDALNGCSAGIAEEREWRVIHSPTRRPSPHLKASVEVVGGIPQQVYKIPLRSDAAAGLSGLDPDELIDRVIIGPTQFSWAMYEAFVSALTDAGVKDAGNRVFISQIPVRT